jgi:putative ABC transport system permease protein
MTASQLVHLAIGVVLLMGITEVVLRLGHVRLGRAPVVAVARGMVQLAAVGLLLHGVISEPWAVALALAVMLGTATHTATRRLAAFEQPGRAVVISCTAGAAVAVGMVFAAGVLPVQPRYVVALGGIVIGNTMTGATLAGRHLLAGLIARRDEVEAWLSLGATTRQAVSDIARHAAGESLVPAIDQTRTTGLVTLPGAFIGALLGGASPLQAARFQLVVLAAILCAQAIVAVVVTYLLGAPRQLPPIAT